jgi:recombination protein RecA
LGIVEKSGAWYSFGEDRIGQGRQNVRRFLAENRDIRDKIADLILDHTGLRKAKKKEEPEETEAS